LIITNSHQKLYFESYYLDTSGTFSLFVFNYALFFWIFYAYSLILIILGTSFFFKQSAFQATFYRNQAVVALTAVSIPLMGNILHIEHIDPFKFFDPTPFLFAVSGLIFYWGIMEHEFLNIIPTARKSVIESMNDGYIVADFTNTIVDINKSALELAGKSRKEVIGKNLNEIFGKELKPLINNTNEVNFFTEISLKSGLETKFFNLNINTLKTWDDVQGTSILIHDITRIYRYQEALKQANRKINLMNDITRHDILNQVNVLSGYTALISEVLPQDVKDNPRIEKYLKNLNKGIEIIHNQISFTKDYQELGVVSPTWQSISSVAKEAAFAFSGQGLQFSIEETELEVYADPLFGKVFYNLFDNSRTHGEHVTGISVSCYKTGENLVIEIKDNGIGVPSNAKSMIFEKSFGKNTGLGLFFIRNVISITGMDIKEIGIEGEGVRFIITVPSGNWRENASE
jgi:PAS domain S-box-containing protein